MPLFTKLAESIIKHKTRNAFFIKEKSYSYNDLAIAISKIRNSIQSLIKESEKNIGLITNNDLETYAAIIALWMEGKSYVPISPDTPFERNKNIVEQAALKTIINSQETILFPGCNTIGVTKLQEAEINLVPKTISSTELAYLFFTSGTTGTPKGVPISRENLTAFVHAFDALKYDINENDRCLQMFELTFDLSVMSFLIPLLKGACVYTLRQDKIKYQYIFELMDEQSLTVALMVPSIIQYLRPYFAEINCPSMKYSLFCGEALPLNVTDEWSNCLPNAKIVNVYGPTEATIFCTYYSFNKEGNKVQNGILSIGKPMKDIYTIIVDENNNAVMPGEKGELCLGGKQLTSGYWNNEEKNKEAFFYTNYENKPTRFYKTGDLCFMDADGDIMYLERIDSQTKIQGFRVELSEIEFYAKEYLKKVNVVSVTFFNQIGNKEIGLVIESADFDTSKLLEYMKIKMPAYMMPTSIKFTKEFPLNLNGKIDRKSLSKLFL